MQNRNYTISPRNSFINCSFVEGNFCGSNGQCIKFECQEWVGDDACYPELVRADSGFAICPRCGVSYGAASLTGTEYASNLKSCNEST